ncbi:MAG: desulfoferrodoxin, partial [Actinobacteria bacterium]|nr:desulfoferrodoxin [Actinomycetota bacterium]
MHNSKFYVCAHCGNVIVKAHDSGVEVICCGEPMKEMVPNTTDASVEKHVPVVAKDGNTVVVKIGSVEHPMT